MKVKIKKLHEKAITPTYATDGSGCFDLYAAHEAIVISTALIDTGVSFEIPEGHVMLVYSRSGHGFRHGVRLSNCVGVIDSDYRGSVKVALTADGHTKESSQWQKLEVRAGDRIAQAMIIPVEKVVFAEADELTTTSRLDKGLGSTGR